MFPWNIPLVMLNEQVFQSLVEIVFGGDMLIRINTDCEHS